MAKEFLAADRKAKDAIIAFIEETEKAYTAITGSMPPFYEMLYDDKNFAEKFPARYSEFILNFYRSNVPEVRSRCPNGYHRSPSGDCERVTDTRGMPRCSDGYHRSPSGNCEYIG